VGGSEEGSMNMGSNTMLAYVKDGCDAGINDQELTRDFPFDSELGS
jgi:hypothetical protein